MYKLRNYLPLKFIILFNKSTKFLPYQYLEVFKILELSNTVDLRNILCL
jgi:hypothetical protein